MSEYTEADMKFDSDPLMQEEDYVEGEKASIDVKYGMEIQPDSVHASVPTFDPYKFGPPAVLSIRCFQLYTDLLPALHCLQNRGRVSMKLIHGICHDAGLRGKE